MISLDSTLKSLEIKLAGAVATTELPFVASYVDINQSSFAISGSSENDGTSNGATAATVVAAPSATTTRKLNYLSVVNVDTAAVTLTVQVNNNATKRISFKATLQVGDQFSFTDANGFVVFDTNGNVKQSFNGILPAANFPALSGDVTTTAGSLVTTIGAGKVTNAMLAGSIAAAKLVGTDIATVGTVTAGVWNAGAVTSSGTLTGAGLSITGASTFDFAGDVTISQDGRGFTFNGGQRFVGNSGGFIFVPATSGNITIATDGAVRMQKYGSGAATFDASGNITSVSDPRFKDRITPLPYGLAEVLSLSPVQHGYNQLSGLERNHLYGGFLADDDPITGILGVKRFMPIAVGINESGYLTLADRPILGATVNAIKTLHQRLQRLEGAIA